VTSKPGSKFREGDLVRAVPEKVKESFRDVTGRVVDPNHTFLGQDHTSWVRVVYGARLNPDTAVFSEDELELIERPLTKEEKARRGAFIDGFMRACEGGGVEAECQAKAAADEYMALPREG
jgi:hypothetical protein